MYQAAEAVRAREADAVRAAAEAAEVAERREALERKEVDAVLIALVDEMHEEEDRTADLLVLINIDERAQHIAVNILDPAFGIPAGGTFKPSSLQVALNAPTY